MLACSRGLLSTACLTKTSTEPVSAALAEQFLKLQIAHFAKGPAAKTAPVKAGKKTKDPGSGDSKTQKFLLALTPSEVTDLDLSPEERADAERRSKEYSRLKMQQHRCAWQAWSSFHI